MTIPARFPPESDQSRPAPLLELDDVHVTFETARGRVHAVNGVSYRVDAGETFGIVGESGCGKSVSAEAILGLVKSPPGRVWGNGIRFRGKDLLEASPAELRRIRGDGISMVFQDASTALNPSLTIGYQVAEVLRLHRGWSWRKAKREAVSLLDSVRIPRASERMNQYPHQFSGGMSQRVSIAMAIALEPDVLVADEPTTALDVTVQAQIMDLLTELKERLGMALILITHDLALIAEVTDRVAIMYAGQIVEMGPTASVLASPSHPYTSGLLRSIPRLEDKGGKLHPIGGSPPQLDHPPLACSFAPRCDYAHQRCSDELPVLRVITHGREAACHFAEEVRDG